jgi:ribonuclease BN (tRNA processing enzyme)
MTIRTFTNPKLLVFLALSTLVASAAQASSCAPEAGVAMQVLGSGGPIADDGRASTGYLVWVDGKTRVLIDAGGGTFLRFGEAGARFADLDFIGLSHLHTDHSADFPALLKSGSFSSRQRSLAVAGPGGDGQFPGLEDWLQAMIGRDGGAYAYLSSFLDGTAGKPMLVRKEVEPGKAGVVYKGDDLVVEALRVPHGVVPAVAFRVSTRGESFVFASDQNGSDPAFAEFAKDASLLVMHLVVPENASGVGRRLHAPPSVIGRIAAEAGAGKLVLSHFMARSLRDLDANVALVRKGYPGEIILGEDLRCISLE